MVMTASCTATAAGVVLVAWIALVGLADAFLPTTVTLGARPSGAAVVGASGVRVLSRAGCAMMSSEGGSTREEFSRATVASLLAGLTAAANFEAGNAASGGKLVISKTASGSRVNKDPISLLQWGLPIDCKPARQVQEAVEATKLDLNQKNWKGCVNNCLRAKATLSNNKAQLAKAVGAKNEAQATKLIAELDANLDVLQKIVGADTGSGPASNDIKLDEALPAQLAVVNKVGQLEALMVPPDYVKKLEGNIPEEFKNLPRLLGRASVEFVMEKPGKEKFDVGGVLYDKVRLVMVLDGFTAPVTAGTIMDLVLRGYYNDMPITRSDGFVVQTGDPDPEGDIHDFFLPGSKDARKIPLEIAVTSDEFPMYSVTTEDDGRGYAATKLPFQAYGALGMARSEFMADSASCQFFWLLFDSDLTPAGKNLLDGRYTEFGYTVENAELLADVKEGDMIKSAKVLSGKENWKERA